MNALLALSAAIDRVSRFFGKIAEYLVLICALVSAFNAIVRYSFNISSNGWLEIQWYMFAFIVLMAAAWTLKVNEHVRVDLIYGAVSDRSRIWIDIFGLTVFLLPFAIYCAWLNWPVFVLSLGPWVGWSRLFELAGSGDWSGVRNSLSALLFAGETSANAGGLIRWPVKLVLAAGFALLALQGVSELIKRVAALQGLIRLETKYEKPLQ